MEVLTLYILLGLIIFLSGCIQTEVYRAPIPDYSHYTDEELITEYYKVETELQIALDKLETARRWGGYFQIEPAQEEVNYWRRRKASVLAEIKIREIYYRLEKS